MNEIEKLYEYAGIKPINIAEYGSTYIPKKLEINGKPYPPFNAEKQLLLLQWLLDKTDLYLHRHKIDFTYSIASGDIAVNKYKCFKESIAEFINAIWQDLTEEEKEQIRGILNG